jgi:hypothetical protein
MRISIIDADEDNVGRRVPADTSVLSSAEDMVSTPSHNSDRDNDRTDNESVLCLLPVVAFDSPHLDPAHRGHTLYAVRLCNTRENDMGSGNGLSTQEGSGIGLPTPEGSDIGLSTQEGSGIGLPTPEGADIGLSTQEGSGIGLPTPEGSNCALLPPLALRHRCQSKKRRAATGTDHPYACTKVGSSSAITNMLTALLVYGSK